ncbi:unnamed protein product [marine sediment metagenome]|uniref:Uncharacterized protein n=1 Tax=marine sediment metagenome TaxID=412755 RepID=X0SZB2_9ZZZZ
MLTVSKQTRRIMVKAREAAPLAGRWYYGARGHAAKMARHNGVTVATAAGIVAALSPGCSWERNLEDAARLMRDGDEFSGAGTYGANVAKAQRIRRGEKPLRVLGGAKVVNFYLCIMRPWSRSPVCIDRHAMGVVLGRKATAKERQAMGRPAQYRKLATLYREAAALMGAVPSEVQAASWVAQRGTK